MHINVKTNKDFELWLDHLKTKYGEDFEILNGFHDSQLNFSDFIDGFIDKNMADVTIDSNANAHTKDVRSLLAEQTKSHNKLFGFSKIFYEIKKKFGLQTAREWLEDEYSGALYLHNAPSASYMSYCEAYDLTRLATEGMFFLQDYNYQPPKHLTTFLDYVVEFVSFFSNRSSGAVGLPNLLIWTWWFWQRDVKNGYAAKDPDYYLRQCFQKIIYRLNQNFLRIDQSAFTNVSIFDHNYIEGVFGGMEYPDGECVIDHIDELIEHQKVFMDVIAKIRHENMFTFPVLSTMLMYKDGTFQDEEFAKWACRRNMEWNDSNFFVSDNISILSNCCRLLSDTSKLNAFINSVGGTAINVGSCQVITINFMRIAYESNGDEKEFMRILRKRTELVVKALWAIRHIIKRNIEKGLLPNYCKGGIDINTQYNTLGVNAVYEAVDYMGYIEADQFGNKFYTKEGLEFANRAFKVINEVKDAFECDYSHNIEQCPCERAAVIFASKDKLLYDHDSDKFIYSNQWYPLWQKTTLQSKLEVSAALDKQCNGGSIVHINIENEFPNFDMAWDTLNAIARSGVYYFAYNSRINECANHHGFVGSDRCPECGGEVIDTWQRVVGFLTPTRSYSKERKREFNARYWYSIANEKLDF